MAFLPLPFLSTLKNIFVLSLTLLIIFPYAYRKSIQSLNDFKSLIGNNILVIPKIAFSKAYFPYDSSKNNLNYGIMMIKSLNGGPDILASHSGNGLHSYFKKLEELDIQDVFIIKENNLEKKYCIINKEYKDKDGKLNLQIKEKNLLILLTCSKKEKDKQIYYIGQKC